jgi:hypothetical protein
VSEVSVITMVPPAPNNDLTRIGPRGAVSPAAAARRGNFVCCTQPDGPRLRMNPFVCRPSLRLYWMMPQSTGYREGYGAGGATTTTRGPRGLRTLGEPHFPKFETRLSLSQVGGDCLSESFVLFSAAGAIWTF